MSERVMPPQQQNRQPGREDEMRPAPDYTPKYAGVGKLRGKMALITGGDSGIGCAVAVAMAREGADIGLVYLDEHKDANDTRDLVEAEGRDVLPIPGDVGDETFCEAAVSSTIDIREIDAAQIKRTFRTHVLSFFVINKYALRRMGRGGSIINTTLTTAYQGHKTLLDYSATKGTVVVMTRSLSEALVGASTRWRPARSGRH